MDPTTGQLIVLHEDAFDAYFEPYRHPDALHNVWGGIGLETFGRDRATALSLPQDVVWTVVDGDTNQWITPGMRFVNRICHLVTRKPHSFLPFEVRVSARLSSLTPLGLKRQVSQIARAVASEGRSAYANRPVSLFH